MITTTALAVLVYCALTITVITPVMFLFLLVNDLKRGKLW